MTSTREQALPQQNMNLPSTQQGLYRKFEVYRTDRSDAGPDCKHWGCDYFVIDVTHDQHARAALAAYAYACEVTHPQLASDMRARYSLPAQQAGDVAAPPGAMASGASLREIDLALAAMVDLKPLVEYGVPGTYDTVQARRKTALYRAERALLFLRRELATPPVSAPAAQDADYEAVDARAVPRELLQAARDNLRVLAMHGPGVPALVAQLDAALATTSVKQGEGPVLSRIQETTRRYMTEGMDADFAMQEIAAMLATVAGEGPLRDEPANTKGPEHG